MRAAPLPAFLRPRSLGLVAVGGMAGAAAREGLILLMAGTGPLPWAVLAANVSGAFLLGFMYEGLTRTGHARATSLRLLLGTGFCGGFTTYSTLAAGTLALGGIGAGGMGPGAGSPGWGWAAGWALGTVFVGALATWGGILLGTLFRPHAVNAPGAGTPESAGA
ncbi:fluoride efflux transporter FluC [Arthrobacter sp. A2-55]|uniref:fluoride efflux transporter FluC n=1 Tax=Arthrobacter sp. A2-55 TaxID=2897337 RepID=UPI0021CDC3EA|nr:CrcB family protein [Arthrobacter sp. A2-55]MCU6479154.1 CrcB family protein [Arthrobacter sp. A2-55]